MPDSTLHFVTSALALLSGVFFASGTLLVKRGLDHADSVTGAMLSIGTSTALYVLAAQFVVSREDFRSPAVYIFAAVGLMRPAVSTMLAFEGTRRIGPTITATVASLAPLFAMVGGVLLLGEQVTPFTLTGTAGVVAGVMLLTSRGRLPRSWSLWALSFPLGAALIRSGAHVALRLGLLLLPSVVLSGLVAYSVSFVVACSARFVRGPVDGAGELRRGVGWFVLAGLANGGAIFCLNSALMLGEVVLVSPLAATYPLFTLLGSWLFLGSEQITGRTVAGVLIAVPSVVLITLGH